MRNLFYVICGIIVAILLLSTLSCSPDRSVVGVSDGGHTPDACPDAKPGEVVDASPDAAILDLQVVSTDPVDGDFDVPLNLFSIRVTFNTTVDINTLTPDTFYATYGDPAIDITGDILLNGTGTAALLVPDDELEEDVLVTVTVTPEVLSLEGSCLEEDYVWNFSTIGALNECLASSPAAIDLGTAGDFAILSKAGISTVPQSDITGDIGVSPIDHTAMTGFSESLDSTTTFATSDQVTGKMYAANHTPPTPAKMTTAISDMETAYTATAGVPAGVTELGAGNISGLTLPPGVYKWGTGLLITTDVTLEGCPTDVWIFQIAEGLTVTDGTKVILAGGAQSKNIFWQVAESVDLGTTTKLEGNILGQTDIVVKTGATVNGRLLAQTEVTLDKSTIVQPAP